MPEWLKLIPGGSFSGRDGRGPYLLDDATAVVTASIKPGEKLVFDQDHATDHALKSGIAAPARGWIVELQSRQDGIWGRVEWTDVGKQLLANREYRGISPVFAHERETGRVTRVLRAALTNNPNLDLPSLHSQDPRMDFLPAIRTALGLPDAADETAILAAAKSVVQTHAAQLAAIATAAKLDAGSDGTAIVTALQARSAGGGTLEEVTALQSRIIDLETRDKRRNAETAIDAAVRVGKPILAGRREEFITRHMKDPASTEAWLADMPSLHSGGLPPGPMPDAGSGLTSNDMAVMALSGVSVEAFKKARDAEAKGVAA